METSEIRNGILMDLIDKMQSQLADKAYPDEEKKEDTAPMENRGEEEEKDLPKLQDEEPEEDETLLQELMSQRERE